MKILKALQQPNGLPLMPILSMYDLIRNREYLMNRIAKCEKKTKETNISLTLNLDGTGNNKIHRHRFFDHMLDGFARHGHLI